MVVVEPGGTQTDIFAKADADARAGMAAADPAKVALYSNQLTAVGRAAAKQKLGPIDAVGKTIAKAVTTRRPKRHYTAGSGVAIFGILSHLPAGLRERLISLVFGLGRAMPSMTP